MDLAKLNKMSRRQLQKYIKQDYKKAKKEYEESESNPWKRHKVVEQIENKREESKENKDGALATASMEYRNAITNEIKRREKEARILTGAGANSEYRAMCLYNRVLREIMYPLLGNDLTYGDDLDKVGKQTIRNFRGVFSSDTVPNDMKTGQSCVVNLDDSSQSGSHWIAVVVCKKIVYVYDSFGRKTTSIIKSLARHFKNKGFRVKDSDRDAEQHVEQNDCGQRSLSFLVIFDRWGKNLALLI